MGANNTTVDAVKASLSQQTNESGILFFAGHAVHDFESPQDSALLLNGSEQDLTLKDIISLDLSHYHLVTLCACETGVTTYESITREYVGLVSGFLRSKASIIMSTLWEVQAESSALFIVCFYYQVCFEGLSIAHAFKEATQWMKRATPESIIDFWGKVQESIQPFQDDPDMWKVKNYVRIDIMNQLARPQNEIVYESAYHWSAFTLTGFLEPGN